jgi:hypothetical protein
VFAPRGAASAVILAAAYEKRDLLLVVCATIAFVIWPLFALAIAVATCRWPRT